MLDIKQDTIIKINPDTVFRDDFKEGAIVYDPQNENVYHLNQVGMLIWKSLDGKNSLADVLSIVRERCTAVPDNYEHLVKEHIRNLIDNGLAGYVVAP